MHALLIKKPLLFSEGEFTYRKSCKTHNGIKIYYRKVSMLLN